jgi:tetratricopeptide (TPR) repeat protein
MPGHHRPPKEYLLDEARAHHNLPLIEEILYEQLEWYRQRNDQEGMARTLADLAKLAIKRSDEEPHKGPMAEMGLPQRDLAQAEQLYEQSLSLYRQVHDGDQVAGTLVDLGDLAQRRGLLDRAAQYYEQALAVYRVQRERATSTYSAALADRAQAEVLRALGDVARGQGAAPRAMSYYEQSLALAKSEDILVLLMNMAYDAGDPARAEAFAVQASTLREERRYGLWSRAIIDEEARAMPQPSRKPPMPGAAAQPGSGQRWWQRLFDRRPGPR